MNTLRTRFHGHARRLAIGVGLLSLASLVPGIADAGAPASGEPVADGTTLYAVDLQTGAASAIGAVPQQLVGVAIAPDLGNVYGLTDAGELATFSTDDLTAVTTAPITGVADGDALVGLDVRPADRSLVALSGTGVVYTVDPASGAATALLRPSIRRSRRPPSASTSTPPSTASGST